MSSREHRDPYFVLGVPRQASAAEIARAYRRAARASHPDSTGAGSAARFHAVSDAYDELRDPQRRAAYDRSHPSVRTPRARGQSVRYAAPGSQHLVLGRRTPFSTGEQLSVANIDAAWFASGGGDIDNILRIALTLLRASRDF